MTDSTNLTGDFSRNVLRRQVFPVLEGLNPRFVESVLRAAGAPLPGQGLPGGAELPAAGEGPPPLGPGGIAPFGRRGRAWACGPWGAYLREAGCRDLERRHLESCWQLLVSGGALSLPGGVAAQCRQGVFYVWKPAPARPFSVEVLPGRDGPARGTGPRFSEKNGEKWGGGPKNSQFVL